MKILLPGFDIHVQQKTYIASIQICEILKF